MPFLRAMKLGLFSLAMALSAAPAAAATYISTVVASGLNNPRDLAFGPDGALYIAEAGFRSAIGTTVGPFTFMSSGSITRLSGGTQTRIVTGLPSLYDSVLNDILGPNGVAFAAGGTGYVAIGLGADPAFRPAGSMFGHVLTFTPGGSVADFSDAAAFEALNNPDGPYGGPVDSNPFHMTANNGGLLLTDAGANALLSLSSTGAISTVAVFPNRFIGSPPPPLPTLPESHVVPTGIAVGPDGTMYVSELTGFPFTPGAAQILSIAPGSSTPTVFATGFTNLTDLAFASDGSLYALSLDLDSILGPNVGGAIYRVSSTGVAKQIFSTGLVNPTGLTVGSDGALYVTNFSNTTAAGLGQVLRVSAIPEPATWMLMLFGFAALGVVLRSRRAPRLVLQAA